MTGPVLIVTGAGRGIGASVAVLAAQRGYRVCVNYRASSEAAERVVDAITNNGGEAFAFQADTSNETAVRAVFKSTMERFGQLDALVNNAGIYGDQQKVETLSANDIRQVLDTNILGYFLCAREAALKMAPRNGGRGGRIVNVSSIAGRNGGSAGRILYATSKGAVDTFTIGLAKELAPDAINVNGFAPGLTDTEFNPPGRIAALGSTVPLGRAGQPDEMAAGILWLLSDEASYCTGSILTMSGGR